MLDLDAIRRAPVTTEPFSFFTVSNVLAEGDLAAIRDDFPPIAKPGIFPLEEVAGGPAFDRLIDAVRSPELEALMEEKLGVSLADRPLMITVRGHCARRDGRIHTDSKDKVVTCLLYLNERWGGGPGQSGGRLRLLRSGTDLDDMIAEVPPDGGTLIAFKRSDNSWHGHHPYEGPRRYIMFNWVASELLLAKNIGRHRLSAWFKRVNPFG